MDDATLYLWPGAHDLPSFDPESLRALALLQLAESSPKLCTNPSSMDSSNLPRLEAGTQTFTSQSLLTFIQSHLPASAQPQQRADALAYTALAESLLELTVHTCFRVPSNWTFMRSLYCHNYSFPSNLLVSRSVAAHAHTLLLGTGLEEDVVEVPPELLQDSPAVLNGKDIDGLAKAQAEARLQKRLQAKAAFEKQKAVVRARELYQVFSDKLDNQQPFFYGDKMTVLDAVVYAALTPVLQLPLPSPYLRHTLEEYPNLVQHTKRVHAQLFAQFKPNYVDAPQLSWASFVPASPLAGLKAKTGSRVRTEQEEQMATKRAWWIAGVGAFVSAFVLHQGIVTVPELSGGDIRAEEADE